MVKKRKLTDFSTGPIIFVQLPLVMALFFFFFTGATVNALEMEISKVG